MNVLNYTIPLILSFGPGLCYSQDLDSTGTSAPNYAAEVTASVGVSARQVAQNRSVSLAIKVTWQGDLGRFEIENVEVPVLTNLEVVENASSNWVGEKQGTKVAVKTYEFILQPKALGMAYVDAAIIEYRDTITDKKHHLVTNRLEVEVTPPIIERDYKRYILWTSAILFVFALAIAAVFGIKRKRARAAERLKLAESAGPVEDKYLADLSKNVDPEGSEKVEAFSALAKLWRRYLAEKFGLDTGGMATQEISSALLLHGLEQKTVDASNEILDACDVAKFSGGQIEQSRLDRAYALTEEILQEYRRRDLVENETGT